MEQQEAIANLQQVANYMSFDYRDEHRVFVKVPESKGTQFANDVANSLAKLLGGTTEVYDAKADDQGFRHIPVKAKTGSRDPQPILKQHQINFPGSGLSAEQARS